MNTDKFIRRAQDVDVLINDFRGVLDGQIDNLRSENNIEPSSGLERALREVENEGRLLQVGIVGRVKAGKSSLLNALFFGGQSVLPAAATPMTAALTTMTYGEVLKAEVEFYSESDIEGIRQQATQYERKLNAAVEEYFNELKRDEEKRTGQLEIPSGKLEALKKWAKRKADTKVGADTQGKASYEHWSSINSSSLSLSELSSQETIKANSLDELKETLADYVGSGGSKMAFTKSVNLELPLDTLKGIKIVDTPGLNDPVVSREQRTNELLMYCDVLFIVSRTGSFLSNEDMVLMGRIGSKEGIRELYVVGTQIDSAIQGGEYRSLDVHEASDQVRGVLAERSKETFAQLRVEQPEVGDIFDDLINAPERRVLITSGISYSLYQRFDSPEKWSEAEQHAWGLLTDRFGNAFSVENPELAKQELKKLANIEGLQAALDLARNDKQRIVSQRKAAIVKGHSAALDKFLAELLKAAEQRKTTIDTTSISQVEKEKQALKEQSVSLQVALEEPYRELKQKFISSVEEDGYEVVDSHYHIVQSAKKSNKETKTEEVEERRLFGCFKKTKYQDKLVVNSTPIHSHLFEFQRDLNHKLTTKLFDTRKRWNKQLVSGLVGELGDVVEDNFKYDDLVLRASKSVILNMPIPDLGKPESIPDSLKARGQLIDSDAEQFLLAAEDWISTSRERFSNLIHQYAVSCVNEMPDQIGEKIYKQIEEELEILKREIDDKKQVLQRLTQLENAVKELR